MAVRRIVELVKTRIPARFGFDPIRDIQVLCPMNRGGVGARSLNIELQAAMNPAGDQKIERFGWIFAPGDKVMQIQNDYDKEVYNGDIGYVDEVDLDGGGAYSQLRRPRCQLCIRRTRHAGACLRRDHPQKPGLRVSCRCDSGHDAALRHAATKSTLYGGHPRQEVGCACWSEEGCRHCCSECLWSQAMVKTK